VLGHIIGCTNDPHLAVLYLAASGSTNVTWWVVDGVAITGPIRNWFSTQDFYSVDVQTLNRSGDYIFACGSIGAVGDPILSRWPGTVNDPDRCINLATHGLVDTDSMSISNDGYLYVTGTTGSSSEALLKFDQDLNFIAEWNNTPFNTTTFDGAARAFYNDFILYEGTATSAILYQMAPSTLTSIGSITPAASAGQGGNILLDGGPLVKTKWGIMSLESLSSDTGQPLADVLTELAERSGKASADVDVSLVSGSDLVFMGIGQAKGARDWMQELCAIYAYRMRNRAGVLQFLPKGGAVVATIPAADLGMEAGDYNAQSPLNTSRLQGSDLPRKVTVIHQDPSNGFIKGQQEYIMRNYAQGQDIELRPAVSLTAAQAREFAVTAAKEPHLERMTWETSLGIKWLNLEPGDPITLPTGRAWIRDIREDGDHILRLTLQADSVAALTGNGLPAALPTVTPRRILLGGPTAFYPLDIPILTALSDDAGFYVAAHGWLPDWPGAQGYASSDGGESYSPSVLFDSAATAGSATNAISTQSTTQWDLVSALNLHVNSGTFSSNSEDQVYAGSGLCAYGADGRWELIHYMTATVEIDGTATLSRLLRGQFGTGHNLANHAVGDKVILLTSTTVQRLPLSAAALNSARRYKAVTLGATLTDTAEVAFTDTGIGLKPLEPVLLRGGRKSSNDLDYSWKPRSRLPGIAFSDPPLGEATESYAIDIYNAAFTAVVATRTSVIPSDIFTAAQQTAAGLTPGNPVNMMVYQISAIVGRGYPLTGTI
jgi:hypothetical protein